MIAVLDANVLYSARLRDFFIWLALQNAYQAHWTAEIQAEWKRNLLQNRPEILVANLERTQKLMDRALPDALLENVPRLEVILPDTNDIHVLEAAIYAQAGYVVTNNLRDFPQAILEPFGVIALGPDDFVMRILERTPNLVLKAIQMQVANLQRPPIGINTMLLQLEEQGLVKVVDWLRGQLLPESRA